MIKEFGKKDFKEIKKLMKKLEKKKECLDRQEDLLIFEKERNLALEKALAKEKVKVEKLAIDLSLTNDSKERMSNETTLINESLASLKAAHSELQESFSCLTTKYKGLEVSYNTLWESTKTNSKTTLDSNVSTSEGFSRCYKIDVQACITNLAKLEKLIKAKDAQIERLNKLVRNGYEGDTKPEPKVAYKEGRHSHNL
jgi:chromosome segregation ATPase